MCRVGIEHLLCLKESWVQILALQLTAIDFGQITFPLSLIISFLVNQARIIISRVVMR